MFRMILRIWSAFVLCMSVVHIYAQNVADDLRHLYSSLRALESAVSQQQPGKQPQTGVIPPPPASQPGAAQQQTAKGQTPGKTQQTPPKQGMGDLLSQIKAGTTLEKTPETPSQGTKGKQNGGSGFESELVQKLPKLVEPVIEGQGKQPTQPKPQSTPQPQQQQQSTTPPEQQEVPDPPQTTGVVPSPPSASQPGAAQQQTAKGQTPKKTQQTSTQATQPTPSQQPTTSDIQEVFAQLKKTDQQPDQQPGQPPQGGPPDQQSIAAQAAQTQLKETGKGQQESRWQKVLEENIPYNEYPQLHLAVQGILNQIHKEKKGPSDWFIDNVLGQFLAKARERQALRDAIIKNPSTIEQPLKTLWQAGSWRIFEKQAYNQLTQS